MIDYIKQNLWLQFGASIDMLKNAIQLWPDERWDTDKRVFYISYHCLVFLDYYLTVPSENLSSPLSFTIAMQGEILTETVDDLIPDRVYSKQELLDYLQASRDKCRALIASLTEEKLEERWIEQPESGSMNYSVFEILLYNMRHVQHHSAQLNMMLRNEINHAPDWISRAKDAL